MKKKNECLRVNLKCFRVKQQLTQEEMAEKIGVIRCTYAAIENGTRNGRDHFWNALQNAFNIPDEDMWNLKKKDPK